MTTPSRQQWLLAAVAIMIGVLSYSAAFVPPFAMPPWIAAAFTVAPAERYWYALPDPQRQKWVYGVLTTAAAWIYPSIIAIAFWFWVKPLQRGAIVPPKRSRAFAVVVASSSVVWFAVGWADGTRYQGIPAMLIYLALSTATVSAAMMTLKRSVETESWWYSLASQVGLFLWAATLAFPWLGAMI